MRKIHRACAILIICVFIPPREQNLVENCGIDFDDITKAISQSDTPTNFAPWVVSIGIGEDIKQIYEPLCTGTIIKGIESDLKLVSKSTIIFIENVILTAAHCLTNRRYVRFVLK